MLFVVVRCWLLSVVVCCVLVVLVSKCGVCWLALFAVVRDVCVVCCLFVCFVWLVLFGCCCLLV